jgi:hypothetical protein
MVDTTAHKSSIAESPHDKVETGAPATEIEVTPDMIAAGMNAYWSEANPGIEDGDFSDRARILRAIFIAMLSASTSQLCSR